MADVPDPTALDLLLEGIERDLHVPKRDIAGRLAPVEAALYAYRRALEERAALEYAANHSWKRPVVGGLSPAQAARNLLASIEQLPELKEARQASASLVSQGRIVPEASSTAGALGGGESFPQAREATGDTSLESDAKPLSSALPLVAAACDTKKLVIVGALAGRRRLLPDPLELAVEWIDTGGGGSHAIGNVPTRIRQGRIFGVIICEQAISHKHSEPLMAAARMAHVAVGFAGKGGVAGIARALKSIEEQMSPAPKP